MFAGPARLCTQPWIGVSDGLPSRPGTKIRFPGTLSNYIVFNRLPRCSAGPGRKAEAASKTMALQMRGPIAYIPPQKHRIDRCRVAGSGTVLYQLSMDLNGH